MKQAWDVYGWVMCRPWMALGLVLIPNPTAHRLLMGCPWVTHGLPMGAHALPMGFVWVAHELPAGRP